MKLKLVVLLVVGGSLAIAAWLLDEPTPAQADSVPEKYRETIKKGLAYLVSKQHPDGHWEGDDGKHPVAMTGLVGLALVMDHLPSKRDLEEPKIRYMANVRRAVDWLLSKSGEGRDGLLFSGHASETDRYMEGHGLATLFLAGVYQKEFDEARRRKLVVVLRRAVNYILKAQSSQGGWYHTSKTEGHDFAAISTTVIQVQAFKAVEPLGILIPPTTLRDAQIYLDRTTTTEKSTPVADVAGILASCVNNLPTNVERKKVCQAEIPVGKDVRFGRDELAHYYFSQALSHDSRQAWEKYRTTMFDHLQSSQNKDGSWPASEGLGSGAVYATALWCVVLQLDKNTHPAYPEEQLIRL